jgi:hypothetical protein
MKLKQSIPVSRLKRVDSDEELDADIFEVEEILEHRRHGPRLEYKLRWRGFGPEDDTWEPESNIQAPELIEAYWNKVSGVEPAH